MLGPAFTTELEQVRAWSPRHRAAWVTTTEAARELGVTARTVRNWCDRGLLRCEVLPSGQRRIPGRAFDRFLAGEAFADQVNEPPKLSPDEAYWELQRKLATASTPEERIALVKADLGL